MGRTDAEKRAVALVKAAINMIRDGMVLDDQRGCEGDYEHYIVNEALDRLSIVVKRSKQDRR